MAQTKAQLLGPVVGDVVMDVSTLSLDAEGNKVGIGTTEADLTLHVSGVNGLPSSSGSTPTGHLTIRNKAGSTHGMFMGVSDASPWSSWIQAQDASNNATNYPLLLNPNGGNVGIGTDTPGDNLEIKTDAHGEGLTVKSTGSTSNAVTFDANRSGGDQSISNVYGRWNGTTVAQMGFVTGVDTTNKNDGYIYFGTESDASNGNVNATERLRITSTGKLEAYKGTSTTGKTSGSEAFTVGNGAGNHRFAVYPDGTTVIGGTGLIGNYNILLQNDGQAVFNSNIQVADSILHVGDTNTKIRFPAADTFTVETGGNERFRIISDGGTTASNNVILDENGNIGIGTDNPSDDLSILASPNSLVIGCKDSTRTNHVFQLLADDPAGNGELRLYRNSSTGTHEKTVEIAASGNSYINSDNNFGIGTTSPEATLQVGAGFNSNNGTLLISADNSLHNYIRFTNGGGGESHYPSGIWYQPAGRMELRAASSASASNAAQLVLASDGNVGIGQSNPQSKLQIENSGEQLRLTYPSVASYIHEVKSTGDYAIDKDGSEKLRITSAGDVSIGGKSYPAWHSTVDALTIGNAAVLYEDSYNSGNDNYMILGNNIFYSGSGGNKYIKNDHASRIMMVAGDFYFDNALEGTANNAITFNTRLKITSGGSILTARASNITYTTSSNASIQDNEIFKSPNPVKQNSAAASYYNMKAFYPHKDGSVSMKAEMYILSGPYYFNFRVIDEDDTVVFNAGDGSGYNSYHTGGSGNVHTYRTYKWVCPNLRADKRYRIQMAASNSGGTGIYASASQDLFLRNFAVYSDSTGVTDQTAGIHILQDVDNQNAANYGGTLHQAMSNSNTETINYSQSFSGTESRFLGWYTIRAYNRYLDVKFNLNYNAMWFAQAYGYLYNRGHVCGSMISGYTYNNNQILAKSSHTFGSRGWYGSYRDSNGYLCLKFDSGANGYNEGRIGIFFGSHGPHVNDIYITHYQQNDSTSNLF